MADELIDYSELEAVLWQLAEDFRAGYRDKLERDGNYTTLGNHERLMDIPDSALHVEHREGDYVVSIDLNDYWKYVEEGLSPGGKYGNPGWKAFPFIREWIRIKPIIPRPDNKGRIPKPDQLAYLITRKIKEHGTTGNHAFEKTQDALLGFYLPKIEEALGNVLGNYIRKILP